MTQHNIVRSEARRPSPHVVIDVVRPRRRRPGLVFWFHVGAVGVGAVASLLDSFVFGGPVALTVVGLAMFVWSFWPDRNA